MAEGNQSQELAIPGQIVKSERKGGIAQTVKKILRRPTNQAITKTPTEQAPGEMSVERAREILEGIADLHENDLDIQERNLPPAEQLKRFGGGPYKDEIKKAFGVYANHLVTTHYAKKPGEDYAYRLLKRDLHGPDLPYNPHYPQGKSYYGLDLAIMLDFDGHGPKAVRLELHDYGVAMKIASQIPLVDVKPDSQDEKDTRFYDTFSPPDPDDRASMMGVRKSASLLGLRLEANNKHDIGQEWFHRDYKGLWRGMRWTAANLLCWDEDGIVYPPDLDKSPSALDKGQAQLSKPRSELPPKQ